MLIPNFTARSFFVFLFATWMMVGCDAVRWTPIPPTVTPSPTATATPIETPTLLPTSEPTPDTGWLSLRTGLERRLIKIYNDQHQQVESLYMFRLDQRQFQLDVAYRETPQSLEDWQRQTDALLVVNGGYFQIENEKYFPDGLLIVDGETFGNSYESFGGMLAIRDGRAELRWLTERPYDPNEQLQAALQSFPVLVKPGGKLGFPIQHEDNIRARRTVIGQDREGRILFLVAPRGSFTLHQLSTYLTESDLHLDIAINLDGGPSSGFLLAHPSEIVPAQTRLPIVILVYGR